MLDQALVSGVNFLTIVLLARALAPADFGWFVLVFTALQTVGTLQAALVTRPHNVLAATRHGRAYADYSTTTAVAQVALTAAFAMVAAATAGLLYAAGSAQAVLVLASIPALVAWQLQELGRRMLYTESRLQAALANDLVSYGGQALALLVLVRAGLLTGETALLCLAAAFAAGALILAWQLRVRALGTVRPRVAVGRLALRKVARRRRDRTVALDALLRVPRRGRHRACRERRPQGRPDPSRTGERVPDLRHELRPRSPRP